MATPETSSSEFDAMKTLTEYTTRATEVTAQSLHYFGEQTSDFLRNSTHEEHLKMYLAFEALISFGFLISAFVLSTNSYAGFTTIFTGLVFCGYVGGTCKLVDALFLFLLPLCTSTLLCSALL